MFFTLSTTTPFYYISFIFSHIVNSKATFFRQLVFFIIFPLFFLNWSQKIFFLTFVINMPNIFHYLTSIPAYFSLVSNVLSMFPYFLICLSYAFIFICILQNVVYRYFHEGFYLRLLFTASHIAPTLLNLSTSVSLNLML